MASGELAVDLSGHEPVMLAADELRAAPGATVSVGSTTNPYPGPPAPPPKPSAPSRPRGPQPKSKL